MKFETVDIFCEVIDNYGDVGVAYRFARAFKREYKDKKIRFIINKLEEINKIKVSDEIPIMTYEEAEKIEPADLIIENFSCNIPEKYYEKAIYNSKLLINIEYFSAEDWVKDFHLQESIIGKGKLKKYFFMPSIIENTGGIILDRDFLERKEKVRKNKNFYLNKFLVLSEVKKIKVKESIKNNFNLVGFGAIAPPKCLTVSEANAVKPDSNNFDFDLIISIFSYEKNFETLMKTLEKLNKKVLLLILGEKTQKNFINYFENNNKYDKITVVKIPFLSYIEYEELISLCDVNFVRGEDSLARALLLEKPFLWHIYPQEENLHIEKLKTFLEKYYKDNKEWKNLKETFISYNENRDNFEYFFENLEKIEKHNKNYTQYLIKNCDLIKKIKYFIENLEV